MLVDRRRAGSALGHAALLASALVLGACDGEGPVEPAAAQSSVPDGTAVPGAAASRGVESKALTGNVYSDRLSQAQIDVPPGDARVEVLSIPSLPAGQYIIMGHVTAVNVDPSSWTQVTCRLMSDNTNNPRGIAHTYLAESRGGGVNPNNTMPLTGEVNFTGSGRLWVECQKHPLGSAKITGGWGGFTQIIATRVG